MKAKRQKPTLPEQSDRTFFDDESQPVATTDFDFHTVEAGLSGRNPEARSHGLARGELLARLKRQNIPAEKCEIAVARHLGESYREIARRMGRSHTWVEKSYRETLAALEKPSRRAKPAIDQLPGIPFCQPLHKIARWAREAFKPGTGEFVRFEAIGWQLDKPSAVSHAAKVVAAGGPQYLPHNRPDAAGIVALVRQNPERLLDPRWKLLAAAFVDLLEAAQWGDSKRRVSWVVGKGTRQTVATAARVALAPLAAASSGRQYNFPARLLAQCVADFRERVIELQTEFAKSAGKPDTVRLEIIARAHRKELRGLSKPRLRRILTRNPLQVAGALAEDATGIDADTFTRAHRKTSPTG